MSKPIVWHDRCPYCGRYGCDSSLAAKCPAFTHPKPVKRWR